MKVIVDGDVHITEKLKSDIIMEEMHFWQSEGKEVGEIRIEKDKENDAKVVISSIPKQKIKRIRRITGYLSEKNNFNEAKKAELKDRVQHGGEK